MKLSDDATLYTQSAKKICKNKVKKRVSLRRTNEPNDVIFILWSDHVCGVDVRCRSLSLFFSLKYERVCARSFCITAPKSHTHTHDTLTYDL